VSQHAGLTLERWREFDRDRQLLMIANEMHRGRRSTSEDDVRRTYERVLRLTDLTIEATAQATFRRELLRWRDGIAELYLSGNPAPERHRALLHVLLLMSPEAARQRAYVLA
jgi:hypothetical protein